MKALKARADAIGNVAHLNDWWRVHSPEIALLSPKDQARLTAHCAVRKAAILQALQEAQAGRMASVPLLAASSPAGRGNRKATHERTLP